MNYISNILLASGVCLAAASTSHAATFAVFDGISAGRSNFNAVAAGAGGTVTVDTWSNLTDGSVIDRGDYTITRNGGGFLSMTGYGSLSGDVTDISPERNDGDFDNGKRTAPKDYFNSGVTLTFGTAINAVGFEVGDWATCCHDPVTELFIAFDGGNPITVATADDVADGLFPSQSGDGSSVFEIFVGAFNDSGSFNSVSFWGNGLGEYLVFGGQVRYSLIDEGSLPPSAAVPLPASALLLGAGMGVMGLLRRRRKTGLPVC